MSLLKTGQSVQSEITNQRYIVKRPLGSGGFGETYAVARLDEDRDTEADETCLKITSDAASWRGEAYQSVAKVSSSANGPGRPSAGQGATGVIPGPPWSP